MATYKKKSTKNKSVPQVHKEHESTTEEVFESLEVRASRTTTFISTYQNHIIFVVSLIAIGALGYLAYNNYVYKPKEIEATSELNQAQYYFNLALNKESEQDSLFIKSINGGGGKYGFQDIIDNYGGTPAAELAQYSTGMAYYNVGDYDQAIAYLKNYSIDDIFLNPMAKGVIGNSYLQKGNTEEALSYYIKAIEASNNAYTAPKFLFKAGLLSVQLGKYSQAQKYFQRIADEYYDSNEMKYVDIQLGKLEILTQ